MLGILTPPERCECSVCGAEVSALLRSGQVVLVDVPPGARGPFFVVRLHACTPRAALRLIRAGRPPAVSR